MAEEHKARAVVRMVLASVPHLVLASFFRMEFLAPAFCLGIGNVIVIDEGAIHSNS